MSYPGRILAVDYGTRRVGIAVSDPTRLIAQGVITLDNDSRLLEKLRAFVHEHEATRIVVGMPYAPDGGKSAKALEVEGFIEKLKKVVEAPIDTWDESYSSVRAQRVFLDTGMKRKKRREKKRVDEMAARLMLQEYLDYQNERRVRTG